MDIMPVLLLMAGITFAIVIIGLVVTFRSPPSSQPLAITAYRQEQEETGMSSQEQQQEQSGTRPKPEVIVGRNVETETTLILSDTDRYAGTYMLGVQGTGKSSLLENVIAQDIAKNYSVIVIDPHGDLIDHVIAQIPQEEEQEVFSRLSLLDIEDTDYPFGLNLFAIKERASVTAQQQTHDRALHVFEKCFPETSHMLLEKYIGNIAPVFFANAATGYSITDIPKFLRDDSFRNRLLNSKNVGYFIKSFWQEEYEAMSPSKRQTETSSLATRLNRFVRSPIVGNIIGQGRNTIDFRKAIENREIVLVKLPLKQLPQDAELIGTMLIAQIHAAIFSFADLPQEQRPGFTLIVDEFQHFATPDFAEMFTEGRKYGVRVTVAHQYRKQLPDYLESATMTARTKICFQCPEDSAKMAHVYLTQGNATVRPEDIDPHPVKWLLTYGHENPDVAWFITRYLKEQERYIDNTRGGKGAFLAAPARNAWGILNDLLYAVEKQQDPTLPLPLDFIPGFCRVGNYKDAVSTWAEPDWKDLRKDFGQALNYDALTEQNIEKTRASLHRKWPLQRKEKKACDNLLTFFLSLRTVMDEVAVHPLGEATTQSPAEVSHLLANLPRRTALVRTGETVATIATAQTPERVPAALFDSRLKRIKATTHAKYCKPAAAVEQEIQQRLGNIRPVTPAAGQDEKPEAQPAPSKIEAEEEPQPSRWADV